MFGDRERDLLSVPDEHILFLSSCFYLWRRSMWRAPSLSCTFLSCLANSCWVLWSCTWRLQMSCGCGCGCGAICWWEKLKYTSMQINLGFSVGVFYARKKKAARTQEWQSCRLLCPGMSNRLGFSGHVHYKYTHLQILGPVLHPGWLQNGHDRLSGLKYMQFSLWPFQCMDWWSIERLKKFDICDLLHRPVKIRI